MYKLIVVGDRDSVYGFAAGGLETYPVTEADDIPAIVRRLAREEYAVIYLVERLYSQYRSHLRAYDEALFPAVIPIPGVTGNDGSGLRSIGEMVERAIGSDVLFGNEISSTPEADD